MAGRAALVLALALAAPPASRGAGGAPCTFSSNGRAFDLAPLGTLVFRDANAWAYAFNPCAAVKPHDVAPFCSLAPAPIVQATASECFALGVLAQRVVTAESAGVTVSFGGGSACGASAVVRASKVTIECADIAHPVFLSMGHADTTAICAYEGIVRARAGCPLGCARDAAGAVCGGAARGTCNLAPDGAAACSCVGGAAGTACDEVAGAPHGSSEGEAQAAATSSSRYASAALAVVPLCLVLAIGVFAFLYGTRANNSALDDGGSGGRGSIISGGGRSAAKEGRVRAPLVAISDTTAAAVSARWPAVAGGVFFIAGALFFIASMAGAGQAVAARPLHSPPPGAAAAVVPAAATAPLIVIYGNIELYWGSYAVKHFIATVNALKAPPYSWGEYIPRVNDPRDDAATMERNLLEDFGRMPDVLFFLQDSAIISRRKWPRLLLNETKYMVWFDDVGFSPPADVVADFADADLLLPTYEYLVAGRMPSLAAVPRVWMPHSALPAYELPFNTAPAPVALLVGMVMGGYPLREAVKARLDGGDARFAQFHHPGWQVGKETAHVDAFAAAMHGSLACIFDGSSSNFVVAKVFEVTATGSLLLFSDDLIDALAALGFTDGVHYASFNASSLDVVVDWALAPASRARVDRIRAAGQAVAHARHRTQARVEAIYAAGTELARAKLTGTAIDTSRIARFPKYDDWPWYNAPSTEYYASRRHYRRARVLVDHEEGRRV